MGRSPLGLHGWPGRASASRERSWQKTEGASGGAPRALSTLFRQGPLSWDAAPRLSPWAPAWARVWTVAAGMALKPSRDPRSGGRSCQDGGFSSIPGGRLVLEGPLGCGAAAQRRGGWGLRLLDVVSAETLPCLAPWGVPEAHTVNTGLWGAAWLRGEPTETLGSRNFQKHPWRHRVGSGRGTRFLWGLLSLGPPSGTGLQSPPEATVVALQGGRHRDPRRSLERIPVLPSAHP